MEIRRNSREEMPINQPATGEKRLESSPAQDRFTFSNEDLTPEGKLTLIIQAEDNLCFGTLREKCKQSKLGSWKEDLEIINGFTYEIDPSDVTEFLSLVPEDAKITVDHQVKFFSREQFPKDW